MRTTTMGLVLRATKTGEADRALLLLTPDGLVSAMAKGALRLKSRLFSGTGLFCYSEFTLFEGKTMFVVDEAEVRQVFWGIHESVEHMALAMYFAELASTLSPTGQEAEAQLRLLLNSLYLLSEGRRAPSMHGRAACTAANAPRSASWNAIWTRRRWRPCGTSCSAGMTSCFLFRWRSTARSCWAR